MQRPLLVIGQSGQLAQELARTQPVGFALTFQGLKPGTKVTPDLLPKPDVMERRAKKWKPWRSVASWYLWRACDLAAGKQEQPE